MERKFLRKLLPDGSHGKIENTNSYHAKNNGDDSQRAKQGYIDHYTHNGIGNYDVKADLFPSPEQDNANEGYYELDIGDWEHPSRNVWEYTGDFAGVEYSGNKVTAQVRWGLAKGRETQ